MPGSKDSTRPHQTKTQRNQTTNPSRAKHPGIYTDPRYIDSIRRLKKYDRNCHICLAPIDMRLKYPHPLSWSADHKIPKAFLDSGDWRLWHISNLQASHLRCNQARGSKTAHEPPPLDW